MIPLRIYSPSGEANGEADGYLKYDNHKFVVWDTSFARYDHMITHDKHPSLGLAWDFLQQLKRRCGARDYVRATGQSYVGRRSFYFHPTFLEPMLWRFGVHGSPENAFAIEDANTMAKEIDASIAFSIFPVRKDTLLPQMFGDIDAAEAALGETFEGYVASIPDSVRKPPYSSDGKMTAQELHEFVMWGLARKAALARSHPVIDESVRAKMAVLSIEPEGSNGTVGGHIDNYDDNFAINDRCDLAPVANSGFTIGDR